jgi:hypothetical protein
MDTSNGKEQPKMQENGAVRKGVKEEGSANSSTDRVGC